MGTICHVVVRDGHDSLVSDAEDEVHRLERLWSRFRIDSEISRLNAAGGAWVELSTETIDLLARAEVAWRVLGGWFDPFMGRQLAAAGYDRDFQLLCAPRSAAGPPARAQHPTAPIRRRRKGDASPLELDGARARLHCGVAFDPGALGKGLAADVVSRRLLDAGAEGALVNLGGDLRARGRAPEGGWRIAVDDPFDPHRPPVAIIGVDDSGLCTSTALKRRWTNPDGTTGHHVLDPRTGAPARVDIASITVTAPDGWLAEALTTAAMLAGPEEGRAMLDRYPATAIVVHLDGRLQRL
jgi:thiamine biosynthesis lipoprotein